MCVSILYVILLVVTGSANVYGLIIILGISHDMENCACFLLDVEVRSA